MSSLREELARPKRKLTAPRARVLLLDGKVKRPRGRHAIPITADTKRELVTVPVAQRLGYRIAEWAALTGTSVLHTRRAIKAEKIPTVEIAGIEMIPRSFAISSGLISKDDVI